MNALRDESFYYQYEQNGGTVEMPKEVFWELYNDSKEEIERLNNIINEFEKCIKFDYLEECEYQANIRKSDLMQGDYPVRYYYSEQNTKLQTKYLNKLQEIKRK